MKNIYFDNAASTPLSPYVKSKIMEYLDLDGGNPSAIHGHGRVLKSKIEAARKTIANILNCSIGEIFFTSGGTESNNTIINNVIAHQGIQRIITTRLEHPSVFNTIESLPDHIEVKYLHTDDCGRIDLNELESHLAKNSVRTLVCLMHANNEIGTIYPIQEIGEICKKHDALFHSDATQTVGHLHLNLQEIKVDYLAASAHKFHGLKGVGLMYVSGDHQIPSWIKGGAQERNMRAGTENFIGILSMADALEEMTTHLEEYQNKVTELRQFFKSEIEQAFPTCVFNGCQHNFLPTILSVGFPQNHFTDMMVPLLDIEGIAVSGGSACSSGSEKPSRVLEQVDREGKYKSIRFSFSHFNTKDEIVETITKLKRLLGS